MKKDNSEYTYQNWFDGKIDYESVHNGLFRPDDRKKIHAKSNEILLAEVDKQLNREKKRIEKNLLSAPSPEKYIQSEIDVVFRILQKDIDYRNDCVKDIVAGVQTIYYKTGRFDIDIIQIEKIRNHYRNYLGGTINYMARTPAIDDKAENIILAIMFYKLDEWLKGMNTKTKKDRGFDNERRVRSFILAEAYNRGETKIRNCSEEEFNTIVKEKFKNAKPRQIYLTVRSQYKTERNFLEFYELMKEDHSRDYNYAMEHFKDYYPDLTESKSK